MELQRIEYASLNGRQKENYNFQKISAVLADYGFVTIRLSDDWNGADFLALHTDGTTLKVQLKPRLTFGKKYMAKELWVCFPKGADWFLYPHDELLGVIMTETSVGTSKSWLDEGLYSMGLPSKNISLMLERYRITP